MTVKKNELQPVGEVASNPVQGNATYTIVFEFVKQNIMIDGIKGLNLNYPQNSLQALPFHDLSDREFHNLDGSCHLQIDNFKDLDLYNLLPDPDKSDDADSDHIFI